MNFVDPSGESVEELQLISQKYGYKVAYQSYVLSNQSRDISNKYAKDYGFDVTYDNKVDAYRHFLWNAMMARDIGYYEAKFIGNLHERKSMSDLEWINNDYRFSTLNSSIIYGKMNQATLMDLWNNQVGRELANNSVFRNMLYEQLFNMAIENNWLITDANAVFEFLGVTDYINTSD